MTISYLDGTSVERKNDSNMLLVDVEVGAVGPSTAQVAASGLQSNKQSSSNILGIEVTDASDGKVINVNNAIKDDNGSLPSGYDVQGSPTYGDGQSTVTTTWPTDDEAGKKGGFVYQTDQTSVGDQYENLDT